MIGRLDIPAFVPPTVEPHAHNHPEGEAFFKNQVDIVTPEYDGMVKTGRALALGATNDLAIPIHHTLGAEDSCITPPNVNWGTSVGTSTPQGLDGIDVAVTTIGTDDYRPSLNFTFTNNIATNSVIKFNCNIISGVPKIGGYYNGTAWVTLDTPQTIVNGENILEIEMTTASTSTPIGLYGKELFSVEIRDIATQEITSMTNSFITIDDIANDEIIQIDNSLNPPTTEYILNDVTVNNILTHKMPFSAGDLNLIQQEPNLLAAFAMGEVTPISSVTLDADDSWYACSEVSGEYVVDQRSIGAEVYGGTYGSQTGQTTTDLTSGNWNIVAVGATRLSVLTTQNLFGNKLLYTFDANIKSGSLTITQYADNTGAWYVLDTPYIVKDGANGLIVESESTVTQLRFGTTGDYDIDFLNTSIKIATASEIADYNSNIRLTNQQKGLQTTALLLDGAGVPESYNSTPNTARVHDDTIISTGFKPSIARYSIEEESSGLMQNFQDGGISSDSFAQTNGTELWVQDGDSWYVDNSSGVDQVQLQSGGYPLDWANGDNLLVTFTLELEEGAMLAYTYTGGAGIPDDEGSSSIATSGYKSFTVVASLANFYIRGQVGFKGRISNIRARKLTTKTQRTEKRLLTHDDVVLGDELYDYDTLILDGAWSKNADGITLDYDASIDNNYARQDGVDANKTYRVSFVINSGALSIIASHWDIPATENFSVGDNSFVHEVLVDQVRLRGMISYGATNIEIKSIREVSIENKYYIGSQGADLFEGHGSFDTEADYLEFTRTGYGWSHDDTLGIVVRIATQALESHFYRGVNLIDGATYEISCDSNFISGSAQFWSAAGTTGHDIRTPYTFVSDTTFINIGITTTDGDFNFDNLVIRQVLSMVEQDVVPPLPDPNTTINLGNTCVIGYSDTIDTRLADFNVHSEVITPTGTGQQTTVDLDHDGLLDTVIGTLPSGGIISIDTDSINVDLDGDGDADIIIPRT